MDKAQQTAIMRDNLEDARAYFDNREPECEGQ